MRAITVRQPWAGLIVDGYKDIENRRHRTLIRERIAIHAGLGWDDPGPIYHFRMPWTAHQRLSGCIIGTVRIVDSVEDARSKWALPGWHHWVLQDPMPLKQPIPYKGNLGFFHVPDELVPKSHLHG